ncbi:MAG: hypothetical protein OIF48_02425, partial [Silicimonas sp.]|nr:hypothetical protein [Silicimonas sp.]
TIAGSKHVRLSEAKAGIWPMGFITGTHTRRAVLPVAAKIEDERTFERGRNTVCLVLRGT